MIICLSGFVIASAAPAPAPAAVMSRNDIVSCAAYAPQHQQLLQQFSARGRCSSSSESVSSHSASPPPRAPPAPRPLRVRTLYACLGESEGELSFEPNQIITDVTPSPEPGWLRGTLHGRSGLVPENYVEPLP